MDEKGKITHFTNLNAWQVNHQVTLLIYKITKKFPKDERFGLIDRIISLKVGGGFTTKIRLDFIIKPEVPVPRSKVF